MILREKTLNSVDRFFLDWAARGELPAGVSILASDWIVSDGLAVIDDDFTATVTQALIASDGCALGETYEATNRITCDDGDVRDFTIQIKVVERITVFPKDPDSIEDFRLNMGTSDEFQGGEVISASEWTVPAGITLVTSTFGGDFATERLSGGMLGSNYRTLCTVTTSEDQVKEFTVVIKVRAA